MLDGSQEKVVQARVDEHDQEFGGAVPVLVDRHEAGGDSTLAGQRTHVKEESGLHWDRWRTEMGWNPDCEDGDIDARTGRTSVSSSPSGFRSVHDQCGSPLDLPNQPPIVDHDCNPIDDDLHEQLDFKHPQKQDAEEDWNPAIGSEPVTPVGGRSHIPSFQGAIQEQPRDDGNDEIRRNLSPHHVNVHTPERRLDASRLLKCVPHAQHTKAQGKSSRGAGQLEVSDVAGHDCSTFAHTEPREVNSGRAMPNVAHT